MPIVAATIATATWRGIAEGATSATTAAAKAPIAPKRA